MALSNYLPNYLSSYFHNNEISRVRKLLATEQEFTVDKPDVKDKAEQQFLKSVILKTGLPEILAKKALINILLIAVPLVCLCILLKKPFILLIALPLICFLAISKEKSVIKKYLASFEKDLPTFFLILASSIRAGTDPLEAMLRTSNLFPVNSVMQSELAKVKEGFETGLTEEKIILNFAKDINLADLLLFRGAFILSREHGASLGPCLERLARVTRQRQSFRRKAKGAVSMQRLSSYGLVVCAVLIGVMQFAMNPEGMRNTINHPLGSKLMFLGLLLLVGGIVGLTQVGKNLGEN